MAPLPQNNTDRWMLDYMTGSQPTSVEHTLSIRLGPNGGIDGAVAAFLAILNGWGAANFWTGWKPLRLRYQAAGTNFSVPAGLGASLTAFVGTGSTTGYNSTAEAVEMTFQGRSYTSGRRGDFSLYGTRVPGSLGSFRFLRGATPQVNAVLTNIAGLGQPLVAIDGTPLTFYDYANANYNSYWETRMRTV